MAGAWWGSAMRLRQLHASVAGPWGPPRSQTEFIVAKVTFCLPIAVVLLVCVIITCDLKESPWDSPELLSRVSRNVSDFLFWSQSQSVFRICPFEGPFLVTCALCWCVCVCGGGVCLVFLLLQVVSLCVVCVCVCVCLCVSECAKIAHRCSLANRTAHEKSQGISAKGIIFAHSHRRKDRSSLAIFDRRGNARLGSSNNHVIFQGAVKIAAATAEIRAILHSCVLCLDRSMYVVVRQMIVRASGVQKCVGVVSCVARHDSLKQTSLKWGHT